MNRIQYAGCAAAAFILSTVPVLAQTDPTLPASTPGGEAIVVTATRADGGVPLDQVAASVTVLDAAVLDLRQVRTVADVLRDVPGVAVSRAGAAGGLTQVRIRGSEADHVLVLIDGIEVSDPFQGAYDFGGLLADEGARVEVLRGQQSSLYGSDAIGGVVQYLTATGHDAPGLTARVEGGALGTGDGALRVAGVTGGLDYALTGTFLHSDGYVVARSGTRTVGDDSGAASAKLTWALAPNVRLTAVGRYTRTDADYDNSEADPESPTYGQIVDSPGVRSESEAGYGLLRGEASFLDGRWTNAVGVQVADSRRDSFDSGGRTSGDTGQRLKGSAESTLRFAAGRMDQRLTLALDLERESFRNRDPSGFAFDGWRHITDTGVVAAYDATLGTTATFGASVRRDLNSQFADTTTYRVQGSVAVLPATRLHAAAGSGVKNPLSYQLYAYDSGRYVGNPDLKPERSDGYEVGVEQTLLTGTTAGVTWFDNRLHDAIQVAYLPPDFAGTPVNIAGVSKQQGVEAFVTSRIGTAWRVDAAYTHLHARAQGVEAVRRSPDIASLAVSWSAPDGAGSLTGTVRYNGPQTDIAFTDPTFATTPTVTLPGFTLVELAGEVRLTPRLTAFARVENLLGERYEEVFSYRGQPRTGYAGVRARF